ncbi:lipase chaperone [Kitasatospora phosalacinea]|uniref:Uncharacterized protein n=1 Tax=Kitasatospora phosalacinea TaxID=2065 RepID=A0A9W6PE44_9ACTN|nr:lipase chaperone [Kitasatospora phosalacinea]GLW53272.1 hypothetical protein Kpho01_12830 [Kitasatospora phosalacinea]
MNDTEHQEMSRALRDLADRHGPAGPAPVTELMHRGRRRRGLRTAAVTGSVAAVAAVAVFGGLALSGGPTATVAGPAGAGTASTSASTSASVTPGGAVQLGPTSGAEVAALLKSRFPQGYRADGEPFLVEDKGIDWELLNKQLTEEQKKLAAEQGGLPDRLKNGARIGGQVGAGYTIAKGSKTGTVQLTISRGQDGAPHRAPATCGTPGCSATKQPDGSTLVLNLPPAAAGGEQVWQATLYRTDGSMITAESGTVPLPGHGSDLYAGPPALDGQQLTALVLDPAWVQEAAGH